MSNYDLDRLGANQFEQLFQALLKTVIGAGTITFGAGSDGGREATFEGIAPYPSTADRWSGNWIFQAKYHDTRLIGMDKARQLIIKDLRSELDKIVHKYSRPCQNYILATNVPLTAVTKLGTHDKITCEIQPFLSTIPHIHIWGYDDIARFLDSNADVRHSYLHHITPGDLIAQLFATEGTRRTALAETVTLFVKTSFHREQYAQLDQAGEADDKPTPLRGVFIDLEAKPRSERDVRALEEINPHLATYLKSLTKKDSLSATETLLSNEVTRAVLIGGPGQGKSTLGQFIAQIHRGHILKRSFGINGGTSPLVPYRIRIPFRVILKDYAQWMTEEKSPSALEAYLSILVQERSGRDVTPTEIQTILRTDPCLIILDGLDEVTDAKLRNRMLETVAEFIGRSETLQADLQIVATSRPTGYTDQFDPSHFLHISLLTLSATKVKEYTERWITAKSIEKPKGDFLRGSMADCLADPNFAALLTTPLQVTIFILIMLNGGSPPRQREELFNEYLEVIYKREKAKSKMIIQTEKRLLFGLHQYLGYLLHKRSAESADISSRMKEDEFATEVFRYLRHSDPFTDPQELKRVADQMIKDSGERMVLLVGLETGLWGFELRSIQEFFAAGYLADTATDNKQRFQRFLAIALPAHWRNVALFFAGRIGRTLPGEAASVLEACREIDRHKPELLTRRGSWFALDIAVDRSFGPDRPLQRSAIEYALTLLDHDLDHERRTEITSRLRQLPAPDMKDHVQPLLNARLDRARFPEAFNALEMYIDITGDRLRPEQVLKTALARHELDRHEALRHALEFRFSPEFIAEQFAVAWIAMPMAARLSAMKDTFAEDAEYALEVLQTLDDGQALAVALLQEALHRSLFKSRRKLSEAVRPQDDAIPLLPVGIFDQVRLAADLAAVSMYSRGFLDWHRLRSPSEFQPRVLAWISSIVAAEPLTFELRAVALGLLVISAFHSPFRVFSVSSIEAFIASLTPDKYEQLENILHSLRAPSSETLKYVINPDLRRRLMALDDRLGILRTTLSKNAEQYLLSLRVTDAIGLKETALVISSLPKERERDIPRMSLEGLKLAIRTGVPVPYDELNGRFVEDVLRLICRRLRNNFSDWRAWRTVNMLSVHKWNLPSPPSLSASLREFGVIVHTKSAELSGGWELCGFASLTVTANLGEDLGRLFLGAIGGANEAPWHGLSFFREPDAAEGLLALAEASDELVYAGMCRWFYGFMQVHQRARKGLPFGSLRVDMKRLLESLDRSFGTAEEGAVLLAACSEHLTTEVATTILGNAKARTRPLDRSLAALMRAVTSRSPRADAVEFFESVLSSGSNMPKSVRYAALKEYQDLARSTTVGILDQESDLGLPFQSL